MSPEEKQVSERLVSSTDPDVYMSPDSARIRSRMIGCIGIRRYGLRNGGYAWMPCTNESDYRRVLGMGPQARRDRERSDRNFVRRIIKNTFNKKSANSSSSVDPIDKLLVRYSREHNIEMKRTGKPSVYYASPETLKKVWNKEIKNGSKEATKRIRHFLAVLSGDKPKTLKYISDLALLPPSHPMSKK